MKKVKIISAHEDCELISVISPAKNFIPDWYKKSPQKIKGFEQSLLVPYSPKSTTSTYKKCSPFLDSITNGYIFSLSQDIEVTIKEDGSPYILWRNNTLNPITWHDRDQWEGLEYPENCHEFIYKWENYFVIKTPKGYSTLFTHPHNRFDLPFYTISGVVDTDKFNLPVHFPFFIKKDFSGIIKAGTPLAQITFLKRESWIKKTIKYNKEYIQKARFIFFSSINRSYKNLFWEKKEYL